MIEAHGAGLVRASHVLSAARSPATRFAEYEQFHDDAEFVRLRVGTHRVRAKHGDFVLVVLAFGSDAETRELVTAVRLYPADGDEEAKWLAEPGFALALLIARYGEEYEVERGGRSLFEPLVDFERSRFVMHTRVELPEVSEALGFDYNPEALTAIMALRLKQGGGVKVAFPIMLRTDAYRADVEAATG